VRELLVRKFKVHPRYSWHTHTRVSIHDFKPSFFKAMFFVDGVKKNEVDNSMSLRGVPAMRCCVHAGPVCVRACIMVLFFFKCLYITRLVLFHFPSFDSFH
jgi:hypothetical protein